MRFADDQINALREEGYVVLRGVVPDEHIVAAKRFINRSLGEGRTFAPSESPDGRVLAHLQHSVEVPAISNVFNQSDILPLAESLLGSVDLVRSERVQVALRFPQAARHMAPIHIDGEFIAPQIRSFSMLAVVFLSDCLDSDMGNFALSPGSHHELGRLFAERGEILKEKMHAASPGNHVATLLSLEPDFPVSLQAVKQVKLAAGDAILLHGLLAHGAAPHVGSDIRYALVTRFIPHGVDFDDFEANWSRLANMWADWPGLGGPPDTCATRVDPRGEDTAARSVKVVHVTSPHNGSAELSRRVRLFYDSVAAADRNDVTLVAASTGKLPVAGWQIRDLERDAREIGDRSTKPFIKDLYDIALERAGPDDWLLLSNCDCPVAPDLYRDLRGTRGNVVEYMRRNVPEPNSATLEQLFRSDSKVQDNGVDALAIRASYYREIRNELPNPLVGAPHWDTLYSGILRRLGPVRLRTDKLFHPEHEPTWRTETPACRYNSEIYEEALKYGDLARDTISIEPERTDTAVVLVSFGDDASRARAHVTALEQQLRQDLFCDFFVVEMVLHGAEPIYPGELLSEVRHIVVRGRDANADLFQKEALMNIGWRRALEQHGYEFFIFVDADVYCRDRAWFRRIRERLLEDPKRLVQGFQLVEDSEDPRLKYSSLLADDVLGFHTDLGKNPGLCWGMHVETLRRGGGFNPFFIDGSGDSGFIAEYIDQPGSVYGHGSSRHRWARQLKRDIEVTVVPDCIPMEVVHVHHGSVTLRNYDNVHHAVGAFEKTPDQLVFVNDSGLLEWKDPTCPERRILRERDGMVTQQAMEKIFRKHDYGSDGTRILPADRRRTVGSRTYGSGYRAILQRWGSPEEAVENRRRGLYVFNPSRVFKRHFPYSWCCHVRHSNADNRIPMNGAATPPELVLDAEADSGWFAAALPLVQSWSVVDISEYARLSVSVAASRTDNPRLGVRLVSLAEDESEQRSAEVILGPLEPEVVHTFDTEISAFANDELDFSRVRLIEILGHGNFCARLTRIVLE